MNEKNEFPRLSPREMLILEMLIYKGEMFGLELVSLSAGDLKRGTIYVTLQRMSEKGYVESREEPRTPPEIGIARRRYWATGHGEKIYQINVRAQEIFRTDFVWEAS